MQSDALQRSSGVLTRHRNDLTYSSISYSRKKRLDLILDILAKDSLVQTRRAIIRKASNGLSSVALLGTELAMLLNPLSSLYILEDP